MIHRKIVLKLCVIAVLMSALLSCGKYSYKSAPEIESAHFKSATDLTQAIRRDEITSTDLLNLYHDRIERYNDDINAVVALDIKAARARAREADKALARGENWGPLHGLPMTVKDVFEVVGMPVTAGDITIKDYIPKRNAIAVQRLIDAGAIIFGKTNVPYRARDIQTYNDIYGTTNNPWDLSRTPGGSSGGSAAALATGFTPLELGNDIGGSVRIPAHYTGVFGHKTTFGIVPRYGQIPPMPYHYPPPNELKAVPLVVVGPLARSADDLELALEVLTTPDSADESDNSPELLPPRKGQFKDYRVAVWFTDPNPKPEIDAEVLTMLQKTVEKLRSAGLIIEEAQPDILISEIATLWLDIRYRIPAGLPLPQELVARQKKHQARWASFFERYDVLLTPVASTVAFPHDHDWTLATRTLVINGQEKPMAFGLAWTWMTVASGLPATVAPVGLSDSGLPVGIQIISDRFEDRTTIDFARGLSELIGGFSPPPGYED